MTSKIEQPTMDDYPTRKEQTPALLYRKDPAVYGDAASGPIDTETLASYDAKGYLQIESLITRDELEAYRAELARIGSDDELKKDERVVVDQASDEVRSVFEVHRISPVFAELARDPRLVDRARQILGSDVYIHQSRLNHEPGFSGTGAFWNSDFETWHAEDGMPRMRAVGFSVALDDAHGHNGSPMVMPGSHRTFVSCVGETPGDHYREPPKQQEIGTPDQNSLSILAEQHGIDVLTGPAGGAHILDANCMHGSSGNITPFPRSNVFVVYNSVENACEAPFAASEPRPRYLGSRDFTPVE
ncbi:ectoine hydroxylase [Streptomonospora sp. DSM 45055]|uniref:Ectoine hydroxylase n=1 Tax=Streptomonospora wellingtoniae TaxID=3075544 RepID=A0ABU2KYI7_9ACTN|nr:ectoine hydroxylase [Streptomonospora sp. DSM 45055]MDT0304367.1 ectoine hydroxylase [Streptomonospora sp. DSM 45055]